MRNSGKRGYSEAYTNIRVAAANRIGMYRGILVISLKEGKTETTWDSGPKFHKFSNTGRCSTCYGGRVVGSTKLRSRDFRRIVCAPTQHPGRLRLSLQFATNYDQNYLLGNLAGKSAGEFVVCVLFDKERVKFASRATIVASSRRETLISPGIIGKNWREGKQWLFCMR